MRFLRAEEGDDATPTALGRVVQMVPPTQLPVNGHKRTVPHAAPVPAPAPEAPSPPPVARVQPAAARKAPAARTAAAAPTPAPPAHAAPVAPAPVAPAPAAPAHLAKAPAQPAHMAPPEPQREAGGLCPAVAGIPPEVLDACMVALRRMGGTQLRSVGVTSSMSGEGRSTVAAAMAVIQSFEYRRKTILIELDGRRPSAAREFDVAESPGVAEFLRHGLDIDDCVQWVTEDLGVVVAGADPSMAKLLRGSAAEAMVADLSRSADVLVIDLPPLEKGAGGVQLVDLCEAVALVVRAGVSRHKVEEAAAALSKPPFVILNGVKSAAPRWVRKLLGMH